MYSFEQLLHNAALKVTPARVSVLSYLTQANAPIDAEKIYTHLRDEHEAADKATIYRIIDVFVKQGIIKRLEFGEGKYRYELAGEDHHHLICENCGSLEDISDCNIEDLEKDIKRKKKFLVKKHALEFFGICKLCQH